MRCIDLSHRVTKNCERFKLELDMVPVSTWIPAYDFGRDDWYVMGDLRMCTHVGTHVEAPLHADEHGISANEMDCKSMVGMAAVVDFCDKKPDEGITLAEMKERGAHIQKGDIVLIRTGISRYFRTEKYRRPYLETDAVEWLIETGIKCLGLDCSGIENRLVDSHDINHKLLFANKIPLIEDMNNLIELKDNRVFFMAFSLNINGLDASMLRPVAIEPAEEAAAMYDRYFAQMEYIGFDR